MDDDFKISMDDIKDMVSELFGEKVDKVGAEQARKILKEEMLEFFEAGFEDNVIKPLVLSDEEEKILKDYETKKNAPLASVITRNNLVFTDEIKSTAAKKEIPVETKVDLYGLPQVDGELKLKPPSPPVNEAERLHRREEILKKLEISKKQSAEYQNTLNKRSANQNTALITTYSDKATLLIMFEQTQKVFAQLLSKLIKRKPVETMMMRTLEKAIHNNFDVLKKANISQGGKIKEDGTIETARVTANLNGMMQEDEIRTKKFLDALRGIFDERLIATEIATSIEVKDEIISTIMMQIERIFEKHNYSKKLKDIFVEYVIPSTTLKPGE